MPAGEPVELTSVPFFPQREYQCGPAALATVLVASGVDASPDGLAEKVYLPARRGSLQLELVGATRGYDRLAYEIEPTLQALIAQVREGRPVLVLQNLGFKRFPVWHYAVVVGIDPAGGKVTLRSGTTEREVVQVQKFMRSWALGRHWAIVILRPGQMPADAHAGRYLQAASGLEAAERFGAALEAYRTALRRWPDNATALLGVGNALYRQGDLPAAETAYRTLAAIHPRDAIARNNLAQVMLDRGDPRAALSEIEAGLALAAAQALDERFVATLRQTEAQILQALR
jgi:tetratricopeptide (TPR) repeat protein